MYLSRQMEILYDIIDQHIYCTMYLFELTPESIPVSAFTDGDYTIVGNFIKPRRIHDAETQPDSGLTVLRTAQAADRPRRMQRTSVHISACSATSDNLLGSTLSVHGRAGHARDNESSSLYQPVRCEMREFQDPSLFLLVTADFVFDFDRRACDDLPAVLQSSSYWTLTTARFTSLMVISWMLSRRLYQALKLLFI